MTPAKIVLAEDHGVVRQGLRALLEKEPGFSVVGEASDGLQVASLVERTKPDVLVLDLVMPGLGGLDVAREVVRRTPRTRIVVLSNPAIGERLGISPRTAQTHRAHVMEKLGLRTRRDLIVYAVSHGLLPEAPGVVDPSRDAPSDEVDL